MNALKIILLITLTTLLFSKELAFLTKEEKDFLTKYPKLKIANEMDWAPFDYNEFGKPKGLAIDHIELIMDKLGIEIEYVNGYTWNELLDLFKNKEIDVLPVIYKNDERKKFTLYSNSYYNSKLSIFSTKDKKINNLNDLLKLKVGIEKSHGSIPLIKNKILNIELIEIDTNIELVNKLADGKLDAIIGNPLLFYFFANENQILNIELKSDIKLNNKNQQDTSFYIGIRDDWHILQTIINKTMDSLSEAELNSIIDKWTIIKSKNNKNIKLTTKESIYLQSKKELNICIDPNWMPFSSISDGKAYGMALDIINMISENTKSGISLVKASSWEEVLNKAKNNECDVTILLKETNSRKEYLNFTRPVISVPYVVATTSEKFFTENFDEINDKSFSVISNSAAYEDIKSLYPNIKLISVNSIEEGLNSVSNKEVYGYIDATAPIVYGVEKYGFLNIKITSKLSMGYNLSLGIKKDDEVLFGIVKKIVNTIDKDESKRIYKKWITSQKEEIVDYSLLWKILLLFLLILAIFIYWNRRISKTNRLLQEAQIKIEKQNKELEKLAITDKLTGIYNRTKLDDVIQVEIERAKRYNHSFGLTILDIDHFKSVNDNYGHLVGDMVLIEIAKILKENTRKTDFVGRWGGEEFVIISCETDFEGTIKLIETIREKIEMYEFPKVGNKTASFGVSIYQEGDSVDSLTKKADDLLYKAKGSGRNKVCFEEIYDKS